jgi:hypothetical protein
MHAMDALANVLIGKSGYGATVQHYELGLRRIGSRIQTFPD